MAPPMRRRSKQNPPTPPHIPLPAIALGLFAAIAAGFAASRALRRKRPVQSLQDEKQSISEGTPQLVVQEREIETKEKDGGLDSSAVLVNVNGTITIAREPSKFAGSLKPVFNAFEEVSFLQKGKAKPFEEEIQEDEEGKGEEEDGGSGHWSEAEKENGIEKEMGEIMEDGKTCEAERGNSDITVKIEASLVVDEASMEALESKTMEEKAEEEEEEEEGEEAAAEVKGEDESFTDVNEDAVVNGDGDSSSADQESSPLGINGRIHDFFKEIPNFKDEPDLLSSKLLSDSVLESSKQEASNMPMRPFVPTKDTLDASWPEVKPDFSITLNQLSLENAFSVVKKCSDNEKNFHSLENGLSQMEQKVPEFVQNLLPTDQVFTDSKRDWATSNGDALHSRPCGNDVDLGLLYLNPVMIEVESFPNTTISDIMDARAFSIDLEGKVSININGSDEGISESMASNGKVLSDGSPPPEELLDLEYINKGEHALQSTSKIGDDPTDLTCKGENIAESLQIKGKMLSDVSLDEPSISDAMMADADEHMTREIAYGFLGLTCKGENTMEPVRINGKIFLDQSMNNPSISNIMKADEASLHACHEETDGTISDAHGEPDSLTAIGLSHDKTCATSEGELYHDESTQKAACLGVDASEKLAAAQTLGIVDGENVGNNANFEEEQTSLFMVLEGITEAKELSGKGSAENIKLSSGKEDMNDGLSKEVSIDDRNHTKEQEIEEITSSCDPPNDLIFAAKKLASLAESADEFYDDMGEADYLASKVGAHHLQGIRSKGGFPSKVLWYLPLEICLICLLVALVSSMLWYLGVTQVSSRAL